MSVETSNAVVGAVAWFIDIPFIKQTYPQLTDSDPSYIRSLFFASADAEGGEPIGWKLRPNSIFDPELYLLLNRDVRGHNPTLHFLTAGHKEFRPWHPLFDLEYVRETLDLQHKTNIEVINEYLSLSRIQTISPHRLIDLEYIAAQLPKVPASQVLEKLFGKEIDCSVNPHPLFDSAYYNQLLDRPMTSLIELLLDFVQNQHDRPPPMFLFDAKVVGDKLALRDSPGRTYLTYLIDAGEHTFPTSPEFDLRYYRSACIEQGLPEVVNPLLHFTTHGLPEDIPPNRIIDVEHCRTMAIPGSSPLHSYFSGGYKSYAPAPGVDLEYLDQSCPDFEHGRTEFLRWFYSLAPTHRPSMHPRFDLRFYRAHYKDMQNEKADAARHFLEYGMREDRLPQRWYSIAYVRSDIRHSNSGSSATVEYFRQAKNRRPKIIFVSHDATLTGAPAIVLRLLKDFSRSSVFECYTLLDMGGPRYRDFEKYSHVCVLKESAKKIGWDSEATSKEVEDLLHSLGGERPIVAFVNSAESRHIGRALNKCGIPVVSLVHEVASYYKPDAFAEIQELSDRVVYPSQFVRRAASRYIVEDKSKVRVIGQGLLEDHFGALNRSLIRNRICRSLNLPEQARIVLSCGTRNLRKGLDLFTAAARIFFQRNPQDHLTYFLWVGGGPEHADTPYFYSILESSVYNFEDRLRFVSETSNVEPYFVAADLFLLTSRADPFPCVVHEALAAGAPVIGFEGAGGAEELYRDFGKSVPFGDAEAMAKEIQVYLQPAATSEEARFARSKYIREEWRSRDYFEFFVKELDALCGTTFFDEVSCSVRPGLNSKRVHFLCGYPGGVPDELVLTMGKIVKELGFDCQVHHLRGSSASTQRLAHHKTGVNSDADTWWDWIGSVGANYRDVMQEIEAEGGGVVVVPPSILPQVEAAGLSDHIAVVCCDSVLDGAEAGVGGVGRLSSVVTLGVRAEESTIPTGGTGRARFFLNAGSKHHEGAGFNLPRRIVISTSGMSEEALNTLRRVSELVTAMRSTNPDIEMIIACSEEMRQPVKRLAERLYPSLPFSVFASNATLFQSLFRESDLFLASDYGARVPSGLYSALALGCPTIIMTNRASFYQCTLAADQRIMVTDLVRVKEVMRWLTTPTSAAQVYDFSEVALSELLTLLLAQ